MNNLTVGQLLEFIKKHNIPDNAVVRYERIEDEYFNKNNWKVIKKEGQFYNQYKELNRQIDSGQFNDKEQYPLIDDPNKFRMSDEELEEMKDEFISAESCIKYSGDSNLYITAHY